MQCLRSKDKIMQCLSWHGCCTRLTGRCRPSWSSRPETRRLHCCSPMRVLVLGAGDRNELNEFCGGAAGGGSTADGGGVTAAAAVPPISVSTSVPRVVSSTVTAGRTQSALVDAVLHREPWTCWQQDIDVLRYQTVTTVVDARHMQHVNILDDA